MSNRDAGWAIHRQLLDHKENREWMYVWTLENNKQQELKMAFAAVLPKTEQANQNSG